MYLCLAPGFVSYSKSSHGFTRIHTDNLLIDCKVQQSVQPTQTMVGLGNPEVLAFLQVGFVGLTEILRHFFKRNVLISRLTL